jgi:hypothetical protein
MGRSIPIRVSALAFPTKTALTGHVRDLIARYAVGDEVAGNDREFLLELFKFHPDAVTKLATGVQRIEVRLDEYGHKHLQLHRTDGTNDDISWTWCVRHAR